MAVLVLGAFVPWIHIYNGSLCKLTFIGWINDEQSNSLLGDNNFTLDFNEWWRHYLPTAILKIRLKIWLPPDLEHLLKVKNGHSDHEIISYSTMGESEASQDKSLLKQGEPLNGSLIRPASMQLWNMHLTMWFSSLARGYLPLHRLSHETVMLSVYFSGQMSSLRNTISLESLLRGNWLGIFFFFF